MPGKFDAITDYLKELIDDNTVPRNIKTKIASIIEILENKGEEDSIKVNKALDELEEISNDTNMQPFTRTQIWNVISLLENSL